VLSDAATAPPLADPKYSKMLAARLPIRLSQKQTEGVKVLDEMPY
jgi:hypothetical protein